MERVDGKHGVRSDKQQSADRGKPTVRGDAVKREQDGQEAIVPMITY
jgi:hypothetical protein